MNAIKIYLEKSKNKAPFKASSPISLGNKEAHVHIDPNSRYTLRRIQRAGRQCDQLGIQDIELSGTWTMAEQWAFYQGFIKPKHPGNIKFAKLSSDEEETLTQRIKLIEWVKLQANMGPSICTPLHLSHAAEDLIKEVAQDRYEIISEYFVGEELLHHGYVGCYNVGRGSVNPPVLLSIKVFPKNKSKSPIKAAIIGKGITFDSGGYILKGRDSGIHYMKADMTGAATVTAALALAMQEGLDEPVELILCCAENMVSGNAYKPGDVLTYKNGVTVEIINTDAEGRVVLADGLLRADANNPEIIIDAATLTGAAQTAVGKDYCAFFSMDEALRVRTMKYAEECNEDIWPLPLELWHQDMIPSLVADTANALTSASPAGASSAAGFLSRFLKNPEQGWLHFDLANAYMADGNALWGGGATGNMVCTLAKTLLAEMHRK
jgi:PepB aminopeptidase